MEYRAISADGHVNEPPTLWQDNLPAKFKERGPRIIETPNTKGHAWIMEGQKRPSPMGFSSMYSRASKRFDRPSSDRRSAGGDAAPVFEAVKLPLMLLGWR